MNSTHSTIRVAQFYINESQAHISSLINSYLRADTDLQAQEREADETECAGSAAARTARLCCNGLLCTATAAGCATSGGQDTAVHRDDHPARPGLCG